MQTLVYGNNVLGFCRRKKYTCQGSREYFTSLQILHLMKFVVREQNFVLQFRYLSVHTVELFFAAAKFISFPHVVEA